MVLPGGPDYSVPLAVAPDDLRQLADHDAAHRTFPGRAGPLIALDTGGEAVRGTALLVAGYTGSKEDFAPLLAPLAEAGYRVVALDQRGQFESPGPDDPAAYSVTELGLDVVAVARVLPIAVGPVTAGPLDAAGIPSHQPERARLGALAREVVARLPERDPVVQADGHTLQVRGHAAVVDDRVVELAPGPLAVLRALAERPGVVVSRADLVAGLPDGGTASVIGPVAVLRLDGRVLGYR